MWMFFPCIYVEDAVVMHKMREVIKAWLVKGRGAHYSEIIFSTFSEKKAKCFIEIWI